MSSSYLFILLNVTGLGFLFHTSNATLLIWPIYGICSKTELAENHYYSFGIAYNQQLQPTVGKTRLKERGMLQMNIGVEFVLQYCSVFSSFLYSFCCNIRLLYHQPLYTHSARVQRLFLFFRKIVQSSILIIEVANHYFFI